MDELLGTMTDQEVADRLGITNKTSVFNRRRKLGIVSFHSRHTEGIRRGDYDHILGTMPDTEVQKIVGHVDVKSIWERRKKLGIPVYRAGVTDEQRQAIDEAAGEASDIDLSERLGISRHIVRRVRKELGHARRQGYTYWTQEMIDLLGTAPDRQIAQKINNLGLAKNITLEAVRSKRRKLGISVDQPILP